MPAVKLLTAVKGVMPGGYGFPFSFAITEKCELKYLKTDAGFDYFAPDLKLVKASFLGAPVLAEGDYVGLAKKGDSLYWVVDNSVFNRRPAVWMRPFLPEEYSLVSW